MTCLPSASAATTATTCQKHGQWRYTTAAHTVVLSTCSTTYLRA